MARLNDLNFQLSFLNLCSKISNDVNDFSGVWLQRGVANHGTRFGGAR